MKRQGTEKCVEYTPSFGDKEEKRVRVCTCAKGDFLLGRARTKRMEAGGKKMLWCIPFFYFQIL